MEDINQLTSYLHEDWSIELKEHPSIDEIREQLASRINDLINHHFDQLVGLLYKVDVNESKLKYLLKENPGEDAGNIIAGLIIERQLQKIQTRKNYKPDTTACDEEKW